VRYFLRCKQCRAAKGDLILETKIFQYPMLAAVGLVLVLSLYASYAQSDEGEGKGTFGTLEVGYKFQSLEAEAIPGAYAETTGMNIATLKFTPKIVSALGAFLKYEFTPSSSAKQSEQIELQDSQTDNGWQRILADFSYEVSDNFQVVARYDTQSFVNSVQSKRDYWFVTDSSAELLIPGDELSVSTVFETIELGISGKGTFENSRFEVGLFMLDYSKPYVSDGLTTVDTIYHADFKVGGGVYFRFKYEVPKGFSYWAGYSTSVEGEADLVDNISLVALEADNVSADSKLEYYSLDLGGDYKGEVYGMPIKVELYYTQRNFDYLGDRLNDDRIFSLSTEIEFDI